MSQRAGAEGHRSVWPQGSGRLSSLGGCRGLDNTAGKREPAAVDGCRNGTRFWHLGAKEAAAAGIKDK